jgi:hypothetical protein
MGAGFRQLGGKAFHIKSVHTFIPVCLSGALVDHPGRIILTAIEIMGKNSPFLIPKPVFRIHFLPPYIMMKIELFENYNAPAAPLSVVLAY